MTHSASAKSIELLAPAGNWECARAAVENGADAIYFGLDVGFNARARAANFHVAELPQLMDFLHRQGVRGYVTLNTLVFTDELPQLEENLRLLAQAGVDAVLVQDLGVARLVRELCPDLVVHASTQMTLTNAEAIEVARELGVKRVVLARELAISEIREIRDKTTMPLEVFVHGALCVAYSGQCLTSESFGGRSANRGQCAQACRLPYDLICDDEPRDLGDVKYLLSPQDLAAHDLVPQLLDAGVSSLKIEGRLKTPEYVANVCQQYRAAIDEALAGRARILDAAQKRELELSFSRGFSPGWLEGCDHKMLVPGLSSAKRGVALGTVEALRGESLLVDLVAPLATGDGVVVSGDRFAGTEIGGRVYELHQNGKRVERVEEGRAFVGLQHGILLDKEIPHGATVFKTDDPQLTRRLRRSFENADPQKRVKVNVYIEIAIGKPMCLRATVATHHAEEQGPKADIQVEIVSEHVPEQARKHSIDRETLEQQFARLGGSVYQLGELTAAIDGEPMVPLSVLGKLRRELIEQLDAARTTTALDCCPEPVAPRLLASMAARHKDTTPTKDATQPAVLRVLCRSLDQLRQVLEVGVRQVIAEFHDIREYRVAVDLSQAVGANIELATLRIHKPGEDGLFTAMKKRNADGWLVRNLAAIQFCRTHAVPFACDFSMNVTNPLTAEQLVQWGATRVTASYDLNRDQLFELAQAMPARWLEVVIHQHMPMFHMEHCVFCSVLSPGKNKSDCGRPCDRHDVKLIDRVGATHVLHADIGCRNTLFNGSAQSGAEAVGTLMEFGVRQFRIELLRDASLEDTQKLVELYQGLIAGKLAGTEVWQQLNAQNRVGVTRGTLEHPRNPLAIL
jgi:U32 family peptidase